VAPPSAKCTEKNQLVEIEWDDLWMQGGADVAPAPLLQSRFNSRIGGKPVPTRRLSEAALA